VQPTNGPIQEGPDDGLNGRFTAQPIQVALHDGGRVFLVHGDFGPSATKDGG
jgi:hypothetical protein